jgi:hypothetical protein
MRVVHLPGNQFVVLYPSEHRINEKNVAVRMNLCSVTPFVKLYTQSSFQMTRAYNVANLKLTRL